LKGRAGQATQPGAVTQQGPAYYRCSARFRRLVRAGARGRWSSRGGNCTQHYPSRSVL